MTLEKPLDNIKEEDLKELIENHVIEKKDLDYKLSLPSSRDGDKKEFLADIVSFANTSGGDIIYGIAQDNATGYPIELSGIDLPNKDQEILRLESIIREGMEPRIPSVTGIMQVAEKPLKKYGLAELNLSPAEVGLSGSLTQTIEITETGQKHGGGVLYGEPVQIVKTVVARLRELQLI